MLWHISVTGRDDVPATEVSAKISLTCDVAQSFTIYMPLLVSRLSRTPPDYLTDVLGALGKSGLWRMCKTPKVRALCATSRETEKPTGDGWKPPALAAGRCHCSIVRQGAIWQGEGCRVRIYPARPRPYI